MEKNENAGQRDALCGRTLGDYHILRRVGGGATSDVFLARQVSLGRNVALKILKDELANDETYVKRFLQEARSAARLEHPNVVRVYEVGELVDAPRAAGWRRFFPLRREPARTYRFIAQEYVDGLSLAQYLRLNGAASIQQTFSALEQIASALNRASELQIVHRDVKPENAIIDASGVIKVVDFGLARPIGPTDATWAETSLTRTGVALGTPLYMSPEQARGGQVDSRSDVYSLGVTAYRMITGVAPFKGETPLAVVIKHLNDKPRPILELRPDAPPALAALIERMLEKDPNDRPDSPGTLLQELSIAKKDYLHAIQNAETSQLDVESTAERGDACDSQFSLASESTSSPFSGVATGSFFGTDEERESFNRATSSTSLSLEWQANRRKLEETLRATSLRSSRRKVGFLIFCGILAFFLGGGVLLVRNAVQSGTPQEPPLEIHRFDSVEEQYVFALQSNTSDAWKSVIEYFPNEEYWTTRAKRQLALTYVNERDVDAAEEIFNEIGKERGGETDPFVAAGFAWLAASRSDYARATAALSEFSNGKTYDRMTEVLLAKSREILQRRFGAGRPGRGGGAGANPSSGMNGMNRPFPGGDFNNGFQIAPGQPGRPGSSGFQPGRGGDLNNNPPFVPGLPGQPGRPGTSGFQPGRGGDLNNSPPFAPGRPGPSGMLGNWPPDGGDKQSDGRPEASSVNPFGTPPSTSSSDDLKNSPPPASGRSGPSGMSGSWSPDVGDKKSDRRPEVSPTNPFGTPPSTSSLDDLKNSPPFAPGRLDPSGVSGNWPPPDGGDKKSDGRPEASPTNPFGTPPSTSPLDDNTTSDESTKEE